MEIANKVERKNESNPRIYVACLSAYNAGTLHGAWIDANQDFEGIQEEIQQMLKDSPEPVAEEWAIHDHEGFGSLRLSEYEDLQTVAEVAKAIEEHGDAFSEYAANVGTEYALEHFQDAYRGEWESAAAYVEELTRECQEIPDFLDCYIDWESMARDWQLNGDIWVCEVAHDRVFIFDNHI